MNKQNLTIGLAVVAIILAILGLSQSSTSVSNSVSKVVGAITGETNFNTLGVSGLKLGSTCNDSFGSSGCQTIAQQRFSTCNINNSGQSAVLGAGLTRAFDCGSGNDGTSALTGVISGDTVFVHFASSTNATNGLVISGYQASTTAGYISISLTNATSTAITLNANSTSSLQYLDLR